MKEIYILEANYDGTFFSQPQPTGVAVESIAEAEKFVSEDYSRNYRKIFVFNTLEEALKYSD